LSSSVVASARWSSGTSACACAIVRPGRRPSAKAVLSAAAMIRRGPTFDLPGCESPHGGDRPRGRGADRQPAALLAQAALNARIMSEKLYNPVKVDSWPRYVDGPPTSSVQLKAVSLTTSGVPIPATENMHLMTKSLSMLRLPPRSPPSKIVAGGRLPRANKDAICF
jgi:hypothetical protein